MKYLWQNGGVVFMGMAKIFVYMHKVHAYCLASLLHYILDVSLVAQSQWYSHY